MPMAGKIRDTCRCDYSNTHCDKSPTQPFKSPLELSSTLHTVKFIMQLKVLLTVSTSFNVYRIS